MEGVQVLFHASHYCGEIIQADLFYYKCPSGSSQLVSFVSQAAPNKTISTVTINGTCSNNAVSNSSFRPFMKCHYDDTYEVFGKCVCDIGYTKKGLQCVGKII